MDLVTPRARKIVKDKTGKFSRKGKTYTFPDKVVELITEFLEDFNSVHTKRAYKGDLIDYFLFVSKFYKGLSVVTVQKKHLISYKRFLESQGKDGSSGLSTMSINRKIASISKFYQFLINDKNLKIENPCAGIKRFKDSDTVKTNAFSRDQIKDIMDATKTDSLVELMHRAVVYVLFTTGVRRSAIIKLKLSDYKSFDDRKILVFCEKGSKIKEKLVHPKCAIVIDAYLNACDDLGYPMDGDSSLFRPTKKGGKKDLNPNLIGSGFGLDRPISEMVIRNIIKKFCKVCEIEGEYSAHSARVSYVTELLDSQVSLGRVSQDVGHSSIAMTNRYDEARKSRVSDMSENLGFI